LIYRTYSAQTKLSLQLSISQGVFMNKLFQHVRIRNYGDASRLEVELLDVPPPGQGQIQIRHTAIGVNFVDAYHRTGLYPVASLPSTLGVEGAGTVEAVGPGVTGFSVGQRVAYAGPPVGSYVAVRNLPAERAVLLPDTIRSDVAAGSMLRGITAHMLFSYVRPVRSGETVLVHAAAGGLGLILTQWAKSLGARVIGTVGSRDKAALALDHGVDRAVLYREEDFVAAARDFTDGEGVDYAIDGIGGERLEQTLGTVRPYGMVASIGQVAGDIGLIDPSGLGPSRSIALARPGVFRFMADLQRYHEGAKATLAKLEAGLRVRIGTELPLSEAGEAHRLMEAGQTVGSILLRPDQP
jgi:NADPH:quinone reductase-like Zn-dependent oxidoreductase